MPFAAAHESVHGPERRVAPPQELGRERGTAEVGGKPSVAEGDARDPEHVVPIVIGRGVLLAAVSVAATVFLLSRPGLFRFKQHR